MIRLVVFVFVLHPAWMMSIQREVRASRLFHSTSRLQTFLSLNISDGLDRYIQHEDNRLEIIKTTKGYEEEVPQVITRLEKLRMLRQQLHARAAEFAHVMRRLNDFHPTTALRLVCDFLDTWSDKFANQSVYGFRLPEFLSSKKGRLPSRADLEDIAQALAEIQFTYNLSTSDIYAGRVMGHQGAPLSPRDAFEIGWASKRLGRLQQAVTWLDKALAETPEEQKSTGNASYAVAKAMAYLGVLKYNMDEKTKGLELLEKASDADPQDGEIVKMYLSHRYGRDVRPLREARLGRRGRHWHQLCLNAARAQDRTVVLHGPARRHHVCRYRRSRDVPYRVYREEILSRTPFLSLLYQVVTDGEADDLINVSLTKHLEQDPVHGAEGLLHFVEGTLILNKVKPAAGLSRRVSIITGLDTTERFPSHSSGQPVHILNYGLAGTFLPHLDIGRRYRSTYIMSRSGERMASVIVYLSDVIAGGATAFTSLNITIIPRKGNALLLYNLRPSGERENASEHAACPVAVGAKWVASKGVWSWGNELRHPCGRKKTSSHMAVERLPRRVGS